MLGATTTLNGWYQAIFGAGVVHFERQVSFGEPVSSSVMRHTVGHLALQIARKGFGFLLTMCRGRGQGSGLTGYLVCRESHVEREIVQQLFDAVE